MNCYMVLRIDEEGKLQWNPAELAKWEKFRQTYRGKPIELQAGELSPIRREEHMKFVRMKIGHMSKVTGYRPGELLDLLMEALGLGKTQETPRDIVAEFFVRFRRMSTKRLTKAHVNAMSDMLDEFRDFWNSHKPPELWLNWPEKVERQRQRAENE